MKYITWLADGRWVPPARGTRGGNCVRLLPLADPGLSATGQTLILHGVRGGNFGPGRPAERGLVITLSFFCNKIKYVSLPSIVVELKNISVCL